MRVTIPGSPVIGVTFVIEYEFASIWCGALSFGTAERDRVRSRRPREVEELLGRERPVDPDGLVHALRAVGKVE